MKKIIQIILITILSVTNVMSQGLCPYIGPDLSLPCGVTTTTLTADFSNCPPGGPGPLETTTYGLTNIPYAPASNAGVVIPLTDDNVLGPFNIGFSFCFFGNTYNQFWVGSNGWISFSAGQSPSWNCATIPIPTVNACVPKNCVMTPYFDFNPSAGGQVRYQTLGVAPCRTLVVSWVNVASFSCGGTNNVQIILYESTNVIESHIGNKNLCNGWNAGAATHGIHNLAGTVAVTVPGRNASSWSTVNNSYRWTPSGPPVPVTYNWYQVGNPIPIGTGLSINVTPPAGGTDYTCHPEYGACYNGYMTCMGFVGANGPDTINVIPGPPNIFPTILPPLTFCPGGTVTVGTDQPYITYLWSDGSSGPTYTSGVAGPISVDVTDINGCTGTANAILVQLPSPILDITPINPPICIGETIQMTVNGANTYVWSPATYLDNNNTAVVNSTAITNITYTVTGTDLNGCTNTITNTVTVNPLPNVIATVDDIGVCQTFSTTVHANGAVDYVWSPAVTMSTPLMANSIVTPIVTTTYQVIGTDNNGCSDTDNVSVIVYDTPFASFSSPDANGCSPFDFTLNNTSIINSGNIISYLWNIEGNGSYNTPNPQFTITNSGSYDVELIVTSNNGCVDTLLMNSFLEVYSLPTADFYSNPNPADLANPLVTFTNTSSLDAINFWWDFSGMGNSTQVNPTFEFNYADTFIVSLLVSTVNGCVDTVSHPLIMRDLSEIWIPNGFTPGNQDGLNDTWFPSGRNLLNGSTTIMVEVYNRWGMLLFQSSSPSKPWNGNMMNGTPCKQDVYVYKIYFKNEIGKEYNYIGHLNLIR